MRFAVWARASVLCLMTMGTASIASDQTGKVTMVSVNNYGDPYGFIVTGSRTTKPACAATDEVWVITNSTGPNAQAMYSTILTAFTMKIPVQVVGTSTCDPSAPTREKVSYINVQQ